MNLKKKLFHFITLQKRNSIGRALRNVSHSLRNALENKMNDNELSGEYRVLRILARKNLKVVFDVGANVGNWTTELKKNSSACSVHLFEPVPQTFEKLCQNLKSIDKVFLNQLALSDSQGLIEFNFYPSNSYFSSIYKTAITQDFKTIQIETVLGDDYCDFHQLDEIDFLKIDVEGAENKVLQGFSKRLKQQKIKVIQFEYGPLNIDSRFLLKDFFELFEQNGYRIGKIYPTWIDWSPYSLEKENFILSNFLAVSIEGNSIYESLENGQ